MDDQQLGELFRSAAASADPPPAAFDHDDVLAGSRRIARRQRVTVAVAVVALAVVGVGGVFAGGLIRSGPTSSLAEAPSSSADAPAVGDAAAPAQPELAPQMAPAPYPAQDSAGPEAAAPGPAAPNAAPGARSKSLAAPPGIVAGCYKPSAEVFEQLTEVLPEIKGQAARPVPSLCGEGGIGAAVDVPGGTLAVVLTPNGVSTPEPADSATQRSVVTEARSGRILRLTASSPAGPPPYLDRLRKLADDLADRL